MSDISSLFSGGIGLPSAGLLGDDSMISPEDAKALRNQALLRAGLAIAGGDQGLFPALSQGMQAGTEAFQQGVGGVLQGQQLKLQRLQQQIGMMQQAKIMQTRQQLLAKYPMPDPNDPEAIRKWVSQVLPDRMAAGDKDMVDAITRIRNLLPANDQPPATQKATGIAGSDPTLQAAFPGLKLDPKKTYTVDRDRAGNFVGKPLEEGVSATNQARIDLREMMTPVQQAAAESRIMNSYRDWMKNEVPLQQAWTSMKLIADRAKNGQGAPDDLIGLVDVMSKMYNPGATVRVGTVQITMDKLGSWKQKLENWKSQGLTGAPDPNLVAQIGKAAEALAAEHAKYARSIRNNHLEMGRRIGDDLDPVLPDPWALGPAAGGIGGEANVPPAPAGRPPLSSFQFGGLPVR